MTQGMYVRKREEKGRKKLATSPIHVPPRTTEQPPRAVQVRAIVSRQGPGSRLSIVGNCCMRRTVTYDASVSANCSGLIIHQLSRAYDTDAYQYRGGGDKPRVSGEEKEKERGGKWEKGGEATYDRCKSSVRH